MWQILKKALKLIIFVLVSISLFAIGRIFVLPIIYVLYSVMFKGKNLWDMMIKLFGLMFVALFIYQSINNGLQQTVNELWDSVLQWFLILGIPAILIAGSGSRKDAEKHEKEMNDLYERLDKEQSIRDIDSTIFKLKCERKNVYNKMFGNLSPSEYERYKKYYDELSKKIDYLYSKKHNLSNKLMDDLYRK